VGDYRQLSVWSKSHALVLKIYALTAGFPREEQFGLTSQIRRAAASIPSNIAEGSGRNGDVEMARFLRISLGSANELEYELLLARDLSFLTGEAHSDLARDVDEVKRMLAALEGRLRAIGRTDS
jgi:four helix bundle protein